MISTFSPFLALLHLACFWHPNSYVSLSLLLCHSGPSWKVFENFSRFFKVILLDKRKAVLALCCDPVDSFQFRISIIIVVVVVIVVAVVSASNKCLYFVLICTRFLSQVYKREIFFLLISHQLFMRDFSLFPWYNKLLFSVLHADICTLRQPWLTFFRVISSVVRQIPGYNSQRRNKVRTLPS